VQFYSDSVFYSFGSAVTLIESKLNQKTVGAKHSGDNKIEKMRISIPECFAQSPRVIMAKGSSTTDYVTDVTDVTDVRNKEEKETIAFLSNMRYTGRVGNR
jgi:hypothetical protein